MIVLLTAAGFCSTKADAAKINMFNNATTKYCWKVLSNKVRVKSLIKTL